MPRKPSILRQRGIRLPETARPGFEKLSPAEQAAAAQRDVDHFVRSLRAMDRERRRRGRSASPEALERRVELLELEVAWIFWRLGLSRDAAREDGVDPA